MRRLNSTLHRLWVITCCLLVVSAVIAQDDFLLDDYPKPGLIGTYSDADGRSFERVDRSLAFDGSDAWADRRIGTDKFTVVWDGLLLIRSTGSYQFAFQGIGQSTIEIDDDVAFSSRTSSSHWIAGNRVSLRAGMHALKIRYEKISNDASMRLFWKSDTFDWEPLNIANTLHEPNGASEDLFERGQLLVEALRCTACHEIHRSLKPLDAPALNRLTGNLQPSWVVERLTTTASESTDSTKMPHFGLTELESKSVAAYLFGLSEGHKPKTFPLVKPPKPNKGESIESDPKKRGEFLFAGLGCLACHQIHGLGEPSLLGGGSLDDIQVKRPADYFARWLLQPDKVNEHHRMPQFDLSELEASDLASYLQDAAPRESDQSDLDWLHDSKLIEAGRKLVSEHRCAQCHLIGEPQQQLVAKSKLSNEADWRQGCIDQPHSGRPHYSLDGPDRQAIRSYVQSVAVLTSSKPTATGGQDLLRRSNCLACHRRELGLGNEATALATAAKFTDAIEHVAVLTPPSLNRIGDKFNDATLKQILLGKTDRRRPWLQVRMPNFRLSPQESQQLADWFVAQDRIPEISRHKETTSLTEAALLTVGPRLVTSNGFGCASCHQIGEVIPAKAPVNARGPNLAGLGKYIRKEWFDRWVADPLRVVPHVEMPAIKVPVGGVLEDDLHQQIDAVWQVLNLNGFRPPKPDPVRIVRHDGNQHDVNAHVLTDVLRVADQQYIKPFLIGLANRNNILFNLKEARIEGWWLGDTASQHTQGKSWYWEASAANLLASAATDSDFALVSSSENLELRPLRVGQFLTQIDSWQHTGNTITFTYRLMFGNDDAEPSVIRMSETITPRHSNEPGSGWTRNIIAAGIPEHFMLRLRTVSSEFELRSDGDLQSTVRPDLRVSLVNETLHFDAKGQVAIRPDDPVQLNYVADLQTDSIPTTRVAQESLEKVDLNAVPGFRSVQLDLPENILPVAFAWRDAKTLFVADLKGRVFQATDSDNDGLPDKVRQFSDELAAPFGLSAGEGYVDVITKYALLRLHDAAVGGRAGQIQTLASGWGHTADYHDWATGLPQAQDGRYFVALSCQQDTRSEAAGYLRGKVIQLVPREPSVANPHRFDIELLSGGHRFPIGIARSGEGELFVTDNQGNYNPFNELNHVIKGHRYGFMNKLERQEGFDPPLTAPSIDIPHPWTRSVNGICFLDTPDQLPDDKFGPFEGHLVGCEYDTRRLIRMSLQRVGDTIQGAAYPMSYDQPAEGPAMLGPISCGVSPDAALLIGNIRESGWGAGQNTGNLVRLDFVEAELPAGIGEIQATNEGFSIKFTRDVSKTMAIDKSNYSILSYTRESTPAYGGDDKDNRPEPIATIQYDDDRRTADIQLASALRAGYVYEFNLRSLLELKTADFFPDRAFYTLRAIPKH